jgi:hypothetical protein
MGIHDYGGANDPLANPPLGGPSGWAAAVAEAITAIEGRHEIRSSRPNTTDHLVEVFDGTEWVVVHYDSGWRDVRGLVAAPWTTPAAVRLRRVDASVFLQAWINAPEPTVDTVLVIPAGFRPAADQQYMVGWGEAPHAVVLPRSGAIAPNDSQTALRWTLHWDADPSSIPASLPGDSITPAPAPPPDRP